jgi:hypothetical protein
MLWRLPCELILEICGYLSFRDVCNLQYIDSISPKVNNVSDIIVSNELKKFDYPITKEFLYNVIDTFLGSLNCTSTIPAINRIVKHVSDFYNNNGSVEQFPCKITLFGFYKLIEIDFLKSYTNITYNVHFLDGFHGILDELTYTYFEGIDFDALTLRDAHIVSKYVVTIPLLKKLFGVLFLDLSSAKFVECCQEGVYENLLSICELKYNRPNDFFLSYNYSSIKEFLKANAHDMYRRMEYIEYSMVTKHVLIRKRNSYIYLASKAGKRYISRLKNTPPLLSEEYTSIRRSICQSQRELKRYFFS